MSDEQRPKRVRITRRDAVGWFDPRSLFPTARNAVIAALMGERSGRREILAALDTPPQPSISPLIPRGKEGFHDHSADAAANGEFWLDFVADLGDGFDATHSVAWLIGRDHVFVGRAAQGVEQPLPPAFDRECDADALGPGHTALPAGAVLVMGGDQVYPFGSVDNYRERLYDPYFAARPWGHPQAAQDPTIGRRALYAIPGNHDWYDGLASYIRQFCQPNRWVGCWQAQQKRSYFVLKLPHNVWLWAIDTALEGDIDPPQVDFFERHAALIGPNDRVVLAVPTPAWLACDKGPGLSDDDYDPEWGKLRKIISLATDKDRPDHVPLIITGDWHHYARYVETGGVRADRQLVTCGIGGAYMLGTARLPETLDCEPGRRARLQATFPSVAQSEKKRWGVFKLAIRYKSFNALLVAGLLTTVWWMRSAIGDAALPEGFFAAKLDAFVRAVQWPPSALSLALMMAVFLGFAKSGAAGRSPFVWAPAGLLHGGAHIVSACWITDLVLGLVQSAGGGALVWLLGLLVIAAACAAASGLLFPLYLLLANKLLGLHEEELYSSQAIEQFKGFTRIKISPDAITLYPIGLSDICDKWIPVVSTTPSSTASALRGLRGMAARGLEAARDMLPETIRARVTELEVPEGATHLFYPKKRLVAHLLEEPIRIPLPGAGQRGAQS